MTEMEYATQFYWERQDEIKKNMVQARLSLLQEIQEKVESLKQKEPDYSLGEAMDGGNYGDVAEVAGVTNWNAALSEINKYIESLK